MKGVTINGVEYLPATALAKQFRYTTDYIGQLCRANKVEAELVGRSWYVNPASLTLHKKSRHTKPLTTTEKITKIEPEIKPYRLEVGSVVSKKTVKMSGANKSNFVRHINWRASTYESDAGDLFPNLERESTSRKIAINLAEASTLPVKTSTNPTKMVAEDLPLVSLHGKLKVASLNQDFKVGIAEEKSDLEVPLPPEVKPTPVSEPSAQALHLSLPIKTTEEDFKSPKRFISRASSPAVMVPSPLLIPRGVPNEVEEENGIEFIEVSLVTVSGLLVMCLLLLFFGESSLEADSVSYRWGIDFSTQSLTALVSYFSY